MNGNDSESSHWLDRIADDAEAELQALRSRRTALMEQVADIDAEMRIANSILRYVNPKDSKPRPQKNRDGLRTSLAKRVLVAEWLLEHHPDDEFTNRTVHEGIGAGRWTDSHTGFILQDLRSLGFIRKSGTTLVGTKRKVRAGLYRIDDAQVGQRMIAQAAESVNG